MGVANPKRLTHQRVIIDHFVRHLNDTEGAVVEVVGEPDTENRDHKAPDYVLRDHASGREYVVEVTRLTVCDREMKFNKDSWEGIGEVRLRAAGSSRARTCSGSPPRAYGVPGKSAALV